MKEPNFAASLYIHHLPSGTKYVTDKMYGTKEQLDKVFDDINKVHTETSKPFTIKVNGKAILLGRGILEQSEITMDYNQVDIETWFSMDGFDVKFREDIPEFLKQGDHYSIDLINLPNFCFSVVAVIEANRHNNIQLLHIKPTENSKSRMFNIKIV